MLFRSRTAFVELSLAFPSAELLLPKNNVLLISGAARDGSRARALYNIASGKCRVVVTTAEAFMQVLPPRGNVSAFAVEFVKGGKYRTDEVVARLVAAGYSRSGHVDEPGRFAVRGDILDVCAPGGEAARIEFFGYDCESVRALDISAQTAGKPLDAFTAYPATELVFGDDEMRAAADRLNAAGGKRACSGIPVEHRLAERLASGDSDGEQTVASLFPHSTLSEFCDLPVVVEDAKAVYDNCVFEIGRAHV